MRQIITAMVGATALSIVCAHSALAADMPVKAPVAVPTYSWTGFYVGGNIGYGWAQQNTAPVAVIPVGVDSSSATINGVIGGGQMGYNWQFNQIVLGVEADFQASGQTGTMNTIFHAGGLPIAGQATEKLDYFGTVRGRIGYAWNQYLPYFTGGWAYGHPSFNGISAAIAPTDVFFAPGVTTNGWTVGGGLEWAFANRWSAKIEYLYVDFGSDSRANVVTKFAQTITSGDLTDNIVRVGLNYKFH
jgi:outer membrane immunogenic protein